MARFRVFLVVVGVLTLLVGLLPGVAAANPGSKPGVLRDDQWLLRDSLSGGPATTAFHYGRADDEPLMCDWNGDGSRTPGVVRDRADGRWVWHLRNSHAGGAADISFVYGRWDRFDLPICGDWNGDGVQTPGVVRHPGVTGPLRWLLRNSNTGGPADHAFFYGRIRHHEDLPWIVVGDWNGDSIDTPGLVFVRESLLWHLRFVNQGGAADRNFFYGVGDRPPGEDIPVVGDWNDNGFDTVGVVRDEGSMRWLLKESLSGGAADRDFHYGRAEFDWPIVWR